MGMFDTVHLDKSYICSHCGAEIGEIQTKELGEMLSDYHIRDCVSHAEYIRVIKEDLFCFKCSKSNDRYVYLAIVRGLLVGIADSLQDAQTMLTDMNLEKIILWYHDLFSKYRVELREKEKGLRFMRDTIEWFEKGYHKIPGDHVSKRGLIFFSLNSDYLEGAQDSLEAIKKYLNANTKENLIEGKK